MKRTIEVSIDEWQRCAKISAVLVLCIFALMDLGLMKILSVSGVWLVGIIASLYLMIAMHIRKIKLMAEKYKISLLEVDKHCYMRMPAVERVNVRKDAQRMKEESRINSVMPMKIHAL